MPGAIQLGFDVARDGRLLMLRRADSDGRQGVRRLLLQNWRAAIGQ